VQFMRPSVDREVPPPYPQLHGPVFFPFAGMRLSARRLRDSTTCEIVYKVFDGFRKSHILVVVAATSSSRSRGILSSAGLELAVPRHLSSLGDICYE